MPQITITFQGVCTHLAALHADAFSEQFRLFTGKSNQSEVQHRVVLPNSNLIASHIDPDRHVPPHIPKLIVTKGIGEKLAKIMTKIDDRHELNLNGKYRDHAFGFNNVTGDRDDLWKNLASVPHMTEKDPGHWLRLRPFVKSGWSKHASAYIDFTTGVKFRHEKNKIPRLDVVIATVTFNGDPNIVFRDRNGDALEEYSLLDGAELIVSNLPKDDCGDSDYLLNYFVTTLDICEDAPRWPDPKERPDDRGPEVYCSSTTFP